MNRSRPGNDAFVLIENEFEVDAPADVVWSSLLDVDSVAPCMPGAQLTETIDDRNWKGRVTVKFGPVSLAFAGTVTIQDRDDAVHRVVLHAAGMEQRGKGAANATVTSWLEPAGTGTRVNMQADLSLTGAVAQLSRGLLPSVSTKLTEQFAACLRSTIAAEAVVVPEAENATGPPASEAAQPAAAPVGGIRLGLSALFSSIAGWFRGLFGRRSRGA
jgi:carbon monoxide dehydrogenase subunit G